MRRPSGAGERGFSFGPFPEYPIRLLPPAPPSWSECKPFKHYRRPKPDLFPRSKVVPAIEAMMRHMRRVLDGPPLLEQKCYRRLVQGVKVDQALPPLDITLWDSLTGVNT